MLGGITDMQSLADLRYSCRGAVFIVASGPSASEFPLQRYASHPMMAMNGSICRFVEANLAPYFYLCVDSSFVRNRLPLLLQATQLARHMALSTRAIDAVPESEAGALQRAGVYHFDRVNRPLNGRKAMSYRQFAWAARKDPDLECGFSLFRQTPNRIGFSRNLDKGYFSARTIPYVGVQMAYHLGFNQVFLVGMDLDSSKGRFYEQGSAAVPSRLDGDYEDCILPSFEFMAKRVVNPDFRVYNLSMGSRLPASVVPKLSLDQLDDLLASV